LVYVKIWRTYTQVPVLIDFYTDWNESSIAMHPVIRVAALGDKAKVIRIDVDKNKELAEAL
jgi:thioredoxin 1